VIHNLYPRERRGCTFGAKVIIYHHRFRNKIFEKMFSECEKGKGNKVNLEENQMIWS
jgi:hypothetical protein